MDRVKDNLPRMAINENLIRSLRKWENFIFDKDTSGHDQQLQPQQQKLIVPPHNFTANRSVKNAWM